MVVVLSTADWNSAVWTNKQHISLGLAQSQIPVTYIESLGLRRPNLSRSDFERVTDRLKRTSRPKDQRQAVSAAALPEALSVVSPKIVPFHGIRIIDQINSRLLARLVQPESSLPGSVLWTFSPVTAGIDRRFSKVVYHSVDLLHEFPKVNSAYLLEEERRLLRRADVVIASSTTISNHLTQQGARQVELWENVADTDAFSRDYSVERVPAVLFAGNLTSAKIDIPILQAIQQAGLTLHIAGPRGIDGTDSNGLARVLAQANTFYHGNLSQASLAKLANKCTVGIIPYAINAYTRGVMPMKVYEYLAAGLYVLSTNLPALADHVGLDIGCYDLTKFAEVAKREIGPPSLATLRRRVQAASGHSWQFRMTQVHSVLESLA